MRISDWSSDVCSSDLEVEPDGGGDGAPSRRNRPAQQGADSGGAEEPPTIAGQTHWPIPFHAHFTSAADGAQKTPSGGQPRSRAEEVMARAGGIFPGGPKKQGPSAL